MSSLDFFLQELVTVFPIVVSLEAGRYLITAGLVSLIIWAFWRAHFATRKIQARVASTKDYRREVLASLRTALIFSCVGFSMHLASDAGWLTLYEDLSVRGPVYFAVTLVAMIVAQDAYFYWTHRAMHHPKLFRTFHWTHHKSKTPTPWTAYAFDAPEALVVVAFVPLWVALVPMHDLAVFSFVTWQIVRNVMGHAGVEMFPVSGKPSRLFGWFNTTTHHDLHHQDGRSNYGLYFSWWDRWMGTEHAEYQQRVAAIAVRARASARPAPAAAKIAASLSSSRQSDLAPRKKPTRKRDPTFPDAGPRRASARLWNSALAPARPVRCADASYGFGSRMMQRAARARIGTIQIALCVRAR